MPDCIRTTTGFPVSGGRLYGAPRVVSDGLVESRADLVIDGIANCIAVFLTAVLS